MVFDSREAEAHGVRSNQHMSQLLNIITSPDPGVRDSSLDAFCRDASLEQLLDEARALDGFRRECPNLYERVRALFFLYAIHRFHLPVRLAANAAGSVPFEGYNHLLARRFEEAIDVFLAHQREHGISDSIASAL